MFDLLVVRLQYIASGPSLEAFCQNNIGIIYIHNNYILVALNEHFREFSCLVCIYLVGFIHCSHNELCFAVMLFFAWICAYMFVYIVFVGCCGSCILIDLYEVSLDCGISLSNSVDIFCHESRPGIKVAPVDGSFPCVLY